MKYETNPNEPNSKKAEMNVSSVITMDYENISNWAKRTQSNPIQTQNEAKQSQFIVSLSNLFQRQNFKSTDFSRHILASKRKLLSKGQAIDGPGDRLKLYLDKNTERKIAKGLQEGDRHAWLQLYEVYAEPVWKNIARLMGNDSTAVSDVVQETFLAAARSARNFDPDRGSLWTWLWTIAARQVALYYRKQKSNPVLTQAQNWWTSLDGKKLDWIDAKADTPPDILQSRELATLARYALSELSPEYQTLLLTKYVDSKPADRIAEQMGCSPVAVRSKLARARKAFRKAFRKIIRSAPDAQEVSL